ncbi:MAG: type II toxin-antitoxin system PemK/MazF family toxin [Nitrosomonas sp.]|nr:MAG: type II toxin-antitoxin system PemK/MazF family toxin [Nitrosomonas sp.]
MTDFKQPEIYWVDLEPAGGAETKTLKPCVIIQSDWINNQSKTLIVAPLLPNHKPWPFAMNLEPNPKNDLRPVISILNNYALGMFLRSDLQEELDKRHLPAIRNVLAIVFDW